MVKRLKGVRGGSMDQAAKEQLQREVEEYQVDFQKYQAAWGPRGERLEEPG